MPKRDSFGPICHRGEGVLPLPLGEGWGEGLRTFVKAMAPHPDRKNDPTSPRRGEVNRVCRWNNLIPNYRMPELIRGVP